MQKQLNVKKKNLIKRKKKYLKIKKYKIYTFTVTETLNNWFFVVSDYNGVLFSFSSGFVGIKGSKRKGFKAIKRLTILLSRTLWKRGNSSLRIVFKCQNLKVLQHFLLLLDYIIKYSLHITACTIVLLKSHNGCRLKKLRRL